ncbi:hypothetical protein FE810_10665 [Thalassotalea litorea]|uniref:DUF4019 domain-containing protein n=1 Tax=Thalassotalea litorea TaxID=2020715 RepID=A0A5R9IH91_9GAMM|nr:hypothetical protein [Thalassotalea litorea]TLU64904.1 hypothetical protein FE810_10665 [Thalassotalea litorea]
MYRLTIFLMLLSANTYANDAGVTSVYLEFESAYLSNDVEKFEPWLHNEYTLVQSLNVPDIGKDSRSVTKEQLLGAMKMMGKPSSMPQSSGDSVEILNQTDETFCAASTTLNRTTVSGLNYEEKEVRKVCFSRDDKKYLATTHEIDVFYKKL